MFLSDVDVFFKTKNIYNTNAAFEWLFF